MDNIITKMIKLRKMSGLNNTELSQALGQYSDYVSRIEEGRKTIRLNDVTLYARHFKVSVNWLIGLEDRHDTQP